MSKQHELKCWPEYFTEVIAGRKPFEIRKDDRGFWYGDTLYLREWHPTEERYTGRECKFKVTAAYRNVPGLLPDHVAMTIARPTQETPVALSPSEERSFAKVFEQSPRRVQETPPECGHQSPERGRKCQLPAGHEGVHRYEDKMVLCSWPASNR
jgi:hypothetical protein